MDRDVLALNFWHEAEGWADNLSGPAEGFCNDMWQFLNLFIALFYETCIPTLYLIYKMILWICFDKKKTEDMLRIVFTMKAILPAFQAYKIKTSEYIH